MAPVPETGAAADGERRLLLKVWTEAAWPGYSSCADTFKRSVVGDPEKIG